MRILQIAPEIAPGTGVGGVAHHLETALRGAGHDVERLTYDDTHGEWIPQPDGRAAKAWSAARVVWFSLAGTAVARRRLRADPCLVAICHNDVLAGHVYVNHGIVTEAMRSRGGTWWRMARNPLHLFTTARDALRYRSRTHQVVVSLTSRDADALVRTYGHVRPRSVVIGNGVDLDRFHPATPAERRAVRKTLGVPQDADCVLFVGHEFDRKGLPLLLQAAAGRPGTHVLVVGGTPGMLDAIRTGDGAALGDRLHLAGVLPDAVPALHAADVLALPSAYEANALVVLEALAAGVPVVATRVGAAPDLLDDTTGALVDRSVDGVRRGIAHVLDHATDDGASDSPASDAPGSDRRAAMAQAARHAAETHSWTAVAQQYADLLAHLAPDHGPTL